MKGTGSSSLSLLRGLTGGGLLLLLCLLGAVHLTVQAELKHIQPPEKPHMRTATRYYHTEDADGNLIQSPQGGTCRGGALDSDGTCSQEESPSGFPLTPQALQWSRFFGDVVLVVSFNQFKETASLMEATSFIRDLYGRIFRRMVFVSEHQCPDERCIKVIGPDSPDSKDDIDGTFNYQALAMLSPPLSKSLPAIVRAQLEGDVAGVLWMDADVILNYWSLHEANKSKVWIPTHLMASPAWAWTAMPEPGAQTADPAENPWSNTAQLEDVARAWKAWPEWAQVHYKVWQDELSTRGGYKRGDIEVARGRVPVFYLPMPHLEKLKPLIQMLGRSNVTAEFALPMLALSSGDTHEHDQVLDDFPQSLYSELMHVSQLYNVRNPGLTPWDYADSSYRRVLLRMMEKADNSLEFMLQ